ncbi:hypothetical protein C3L33_20438, partial [Rhododendron williamsianum]
MSRASNIIFCSSLLWLSSRFSFGLAMLAFIGFFRHHLLVTGYLLVFVVVCAIGRILITEAYRKLKAHLSYHINTRFVNLFSGEIWPDRLLLLSNNVFNLAGSRGKFPLSSFLLRSKVKYGELGKVPDAGVRNPLYPAASRSISTTRAVELSTGTVHTIPRNCSSGFSHGSAGNPRFLGRKMEVLCRDQFPVSGFEGLLYLIVKSRVHEPWNESRDDYGNGE